MYPFCIKQQLAVYEILRVKMAELSSIAAIKGRRGLRLRARKTVDIPALPRLQHINVEPRNKLYDISITEELEDKVKVHHVGYPEKFDEWRSRSDVVHKSSIDEDVELSPSYLLACSIKQRLFPRKLDDPAVKLVIHNVQGCPRFARITECGTCAHDNSGTPTTP